MQGLLKGNLSEDAASSGSRSDQLLERVLGPLFEQCARKIEQHRLGRDHALQRTVDRAGERIRHGGFRGRPALAESAACGWRASLRRRIEHDFHQGGARDAVGQGMVHARDDRAPPAAQAVHHVDVPERLSRSITCVRTRLASASICSWSPGASTVTWKMWRWMSKAGVVLPVGIAEMEWRIDHDLAVARNQVELGIDRGDKLFERDLASSKMQTPAMCRGISLRSR